MIRWGLPLLVGVALLVGCTGHLDFDPTVGSAGIEKMPSGSGGAGGAVSGSGGAPAMDAAAPTPEAGAPDNNAGAPGADGGEGSDSGVSVADTTAPQAACPPGFNVLTAVFANKCGGCHGATSPTKNLDMVSAGLGTRMVNKVSTCSNKPLVSATLNGTKPTGLLFEKLLGNVAGCGVRMPAGAPALTESELVCVDEWAVAAINKFLGR